MLTNAEAALKLNQFKPRPYQLPMLKALDSGYKRVLAILPRRAGKDVTALNYMIRRMYEEPGVYYYIFPTYSQAKKVIWDSITNSGFRMLDYFPAELVLQKNSQEMKIRMETKDGRESLFQLVGSDNYNSLVGTNPRGVVFSEYALQDPMAYQYLRPILTANGGWALFISTPRGKNSLWTLKELAERSPEWFYYKLSVEETEHIPLSEIDRERREGLMSEDMIMQEYYCFPPEAEVMTPTGLVPIARIATRDLVIAHTGRPRIVTNTITHHHPGELVEVASYGSFEPIQSTPNHPYRVYDRVSQSYSWKQAADLTPDDWLFIPKVPPGRKVLSREMALLMSWYICDGSSFTNGLQFTVRMGEKEIRVKHLLRELALPYRSFPSQGCVNIVVNDTALINLLKTHCGTHAQNKRIPLELIGGWETPFFHELMKGDGCTLQGEGRQYLFSTTSKFLAYQVQRLAISVSEPYTASVGYRAPSKLEIRGREVKGGPSYCVPIYHYRRKREGHGLRRTKYGMVAKVRSTATVPYRGPVYNLSVQYDESYLVAGRAVHNCSFDMGVEGSYYAKYIDVAKREHRIADVPHENGFKVHTAWDLGVRDSTCIIFFQVIGQTVRLIDYYENSKEGLEHYAKVIHSKPYIYGKHFAPHDIKVKEWGSGITRLQKARELGIPFILAPDVDLLDGIETVRSSFSKIHIDATKCEQLVKALENYRQEWDNKRKVYSPRPLHNWASHAGDAMRYLCISLPRTRDSDSPEQLEQRYREAMGVTPTHGDIFEQPTPYGHNVTSW